MNRAIKRITKDIRDIYKNPLHDNKIYIHYDEENIFKMYCLMIGTEDTPYENGFYFFNFTFSDEYPLKPPKVEYCTLDANRTVRFNQIYILVVRYVYQYWERGKGSSGVH